MDESLSPERDPASQSAASSARARPGGAGGVRIGVDTGGTFTDLVARIPGEPARIVKVRSTPDDPGRALVEGLEKLGIPRAEGAVVIHGTTVALNALLTGRLGKTALVTNEGFRDLIEIDRQSREDLYALEPERPTPLVPRERRFEVKERVWPPLESADGSGARAPYEVIQALGEEELLAVVDDVVASGAESVAVCLLHSYAHPESERRIAEALRARGVQATASSDLVAEYREAERFSTAAANAALIPVLRGYLQRLDRALPEANLEILQSSGGGLKSAVAAVEPVRVLLSGPAGGVMGAADAARAVGLGAIATLDMGGTSTDVAFHQEGQGLGSLGEEVRVAGHSIAVPTLDMHTIGCGGGSIAYVDEGSILRVGPMSAGADPGPVSFGNGGTQPTVTDAYVVLGRVPLEPRKGGFLDGELRLDRDGAIRAFEALGARLGGGTTATEAAVAVLASVRASMRRALGVMTMQRGRDPKATPLVAFGGGGGLAGADLAQALGMPSTLIPAYPGVLSAQGMTTAPMTADRSRTILRPLSEVPEAHRQELIRELELDALRALGGPAKGVEFESRLSLRYRGQSYELALGNRAALAQAFHGAHEERFGWRLDDHPIELVHVRGRATRALGGEAVTPIEPGPLDVAAEPVAPPDSVTTQRAYFEDTGEVDIPVFDLSCLSPGTQVQGPALIDAYSGTTVVPPGAYARVVTSEGALLIRRRP